MRASTIILLPLALVLALAGCIKDDEWSRYNKAPGMPCETADECAACPADADWDCAGPIGDEGICMAGHCRMTTGEVGLNCNAENPGTCDYDYCVYAGAAERGLCSKTCGDGTCPGERFVCAQTNSSSGGTIYWCAQRCAVDTDCDSNASCKENGSAGQVCFPK
jgi:hypothetical protein